MSFTEWDQGFTPKEHREMIDTRGLERRREEQRKSDRRWRLFEHDYWGTEITRRCSLTLRHLSEGDCRPVVTKLGLKWRGGTHRFANRGQADREKGGPVESRR